MLIEIDEELYNKMLKIVKGRNLSLYEELQHIEPITNLNQDDTLTTAREIKTSRVKERIKIALRNLLQAKEQPTKYKVHKSTKIAYVTLNKYYDDILDEVENEG